MVSNGMDTEVELTKDILLDILDCSCVGSISEDTVRWCEHFNADCDKCSAEIASRIVPLSEVYVVTRIPYGNHNSTNAATLVGIYRTLDDAKATVELKTMEFRPIAISYDECIKYGYTLNGDDVVSSAQFPQYFIQRYLI